MSSLVAKAQVVTADLSPLATANSFLPVTMTPEGRVRVDAALSVADVEISALTANASSATGGIASTARLASSAASTNATNVKTTAGRVYACQGRNLASYDVFLVLYDSAANPPVPGSTTIRKKVCIPANSAFALDWPLGMSFATGIGYALTKLVADADTTAVAAADVIALNIDYV